MLPLAKQTSAWGMQAGLIILYIIFTFPLCIGYILAVAVELEEAAIMDGATTRVFSGKSFSRCLCQ
ncbi:hypothetical protein [Cytobacillus sp. BC1816]|uniref:hypothetical protein n=1 Tax=Cytobacillus sp. BC1816 TaxID=3440154 RepID=UPI003F513B98